MDTPLLTKLYVPRPRPNRVARLRLLDRLNAGLHRQLSLVSAPAGFGKTTLLADWLAAAGRPAAWLALDEEDNDPVQFLTYLIAALQQVDARIGRTILPALQSPQPPPLSSLIPPLINDISAAGTALILVLDDYHLITAPAAHQALEFLLDHQPPQLHLVISTRADPPLPLPRLRARGQVTEIRERDLRFSGEETAAFLNRTMALALPVEAVGALETRTEGWIAGLQLAALALQEEPDPDRAAAFIASFTGDNRYVTDYLVAEVLQRQPEPVRNFLRQTASLDRLTAPLCNALTGREDGQAMLERLEGANLFLIPLDQRREWYRYYRLFAEALRATLSPAERARQHEQAARWYESRGLAGQAIHHALAWAAAMPGPAAGPALDYAGRLIRRAAEEMLHRGAILTVQNWLDALPDDRVRADGQLATYRGWVLAISGEMALAEDYAAAAERLLRRPAEPDAGTETDLGRLLVLRSFLTVIMRKDYPAAVQLAGEALRRLPESQPHWRVMALWTMAEAQERTAAITEAIAAWREARRLGRGLGNQFFTILVEAFLAAALHAHGRRREALAVCEAAVERYTDAQGQALPGMGLIYSRLALLHCEANELALARRCQERALELSEQLALAGYLLAIYGLAAPIHQALGEIEAALALLDQAYQLIVQTGLSEADWLQAWQANIYLQQGNLPAARRWAETAGPSPDEAPDYLRLEPHLTYGRLLLAEGQPAEARRWLARLAEFLRARGLNRGLITVYLLQALAAEREGNRPAARDYLGRAVQLAAPEEFVRAFLDEDPQLVTLLPEVRAIAPLFVARLLEAAGRDPARPAVPAQPLVEPLSERELEILRLIAAGLSNPEIGRELVIATSTVKRHTNHIYGKLGVSSRTQAVAKARELRLLE